MPAHKLPPLSAEEQHRRRLKRREQNRLAQQRHRARERGEQVPDCPYASTSTATAKGKRAEKSKSASPSLSPPPLVSAGTKRKQSDAEADADAEASSSYASHNADVSEPPQWASFEDEFASSSSSRASTGSFGSPRLELNLGGAQDSLHGSEAGANEITQDNRSNPFGSASPRERQQPLCSVTSTANSLYHASTAPVGSLPSSTSGETLSPEDMLFFSKAATEASGLASVADADDALLDGEVGADMGIGMQIAEWALAAPAAAQDTGAQLASTLPIDPNQLPQDLQSASSSTVLTPGSFDSSVGASDLSGSQQDHFQPQRQHVQTSLGYPSTIKSAPKCDAMKAAYRSLLNTHGVQDGLEEQQGKESGFGRNDAFANLKTGENGSNVQSRPAFNYPATDQEIEIIKSLLAAQSMAAMNNTRESEAERPDWLAIANLALAWAHEAGKAHKKASSEALCLLKDPYSSAVLSALLPASAGALTDRAFVEPTEEEREEVTISSTSSSPDSLQSNHSLSIALNGHSHYPSPLIWANQMVMPRFDMVKVYYLAADRLGVPFDIADDDFLMSSLPGDFVQFQQAQLMRFVTGESQPKRQQLVQLKRLDEIGDAALKEEERRPITARPGPLMPRGLRWDRLPPPFHPTCYSFAVPHHMYLDLAFPWPSFRNRLLYSIKAKKIDVMQFCMDAWERFGLDGSEPMYMVHGDDPFLVDSYEFSQRFVEKYSILFDNDMLKRTNYWRRRRGNKPLKVCVPDSFTADFERALRLSDLEPILDL